MKTVEIDILQAANDVFVTRRDSMDMEYNLHGKTTRNPSISTLHRLGQVINKHCTVELVPDGYSLYIRARRNHCPTCGDGDIEPPDHEIDIPDCVLEDDCEPEEFSWRWPPPQG